MTRPDFRLLLVIFGMIPLILGLILDIPVLVFVSCIYFGGALLTGRFDEKHLENVKVEAKPLSWYEKGYRDGLNNLVADQQLYLSAKTEEKREYDAGYMDGSGDRHQIRQSAII